MPGATREAAKQGKQAGPAKSAGRWGKARGASVPPARRGGASGPARARLRDVKRAFDRPLTAYYLLLGAGLLLSVLGLVMVLSASQIFSRVTYGDFSAVFVKQAVAIAIGLPLMFIGARLPVRVYRMLAYPLLIGSVFALCLVLVPGIGMEVNGNRNWIALGGVFQIQPSEFAKLGLVLWGADLLARKDRLLGQWRHLFIPLFPGALLVLGLVMVGGDMGTAMIIVAIVLALLWVAGAPGRLFVLALSSAAALATVFILMKPHRAARFDSFLDPFSDPQGETLQAAHGIYALSTGGFFGSGIGTSYEKWGTLPEAHTDFIFAVIGEELGLVGTLSVLSLFAALGYAGIRVAGRTKDPFVRLAAGGATAWITAQATINIGAVLGLLPIAGVPLPLVSYGGSALLPTMFAVGMLLSFARTEPGAQKQLAAQGRGAVRRAFARVLPRRER
ncbi:putative lipid II flippase FtsW [Yinghuangia sp. ASG 101]|uniref:putative lipid II flippase FtsW n=1 Tax=Yinghuangia sp. ASG 101 TaxID=2896848 RepID=UPI001E46DB1B|nr:putative lipid II flippase FtsW [Yinghuangia sp. ASG 101]UGQ10061.1 putative lipid II flippase FtsW [Yinghuangia sp. ASG 101]